MNDDEADTTEEGLNVVTIDRNIAPVERKEPPVLESEIDIRSQRLSDTFPVRAKLYDRTNTLPNRLYRRFISQYILQPIIYILFPRVLNNQAIVRLLSFRPTTQVKVIYTNFLIHHVNQT